MRELEGYYSDIVKKNFPYLSKKSKKSFAREITHLARKQKEMNAKMVEFSIDLPMNVLLDEDFNPLIPKK